MKKTIMTALFGIACAAIASADSYTTSYGASATTGTSSLYSFAWTLSFSDAFMSTQNATGGTVTLSATDIISLTNVSLGCTTTGLHLAVYEGQGGIAGTYNSLSNYNFTQTIGDFVGVSSSTSIADGTMNFSFDNLELTAGQTYTFAFVNTNTVSQLDSDDDAYRTALLVNHSKRPSYTALSDSSVTGGYYNRWNSSLTTGTLPVATYTHGLTTASVPEPATATLSLLALAGLAARRRRK